MTAADNSKHSDESSPPLADKPPVPKKKRKRNSSQPARAKNGDLPPAKQAKSAHSRSVKLVLKCQIIYFRSQSLNKKHTKRGGLADDINKLDQAIKTIKRLSEDPTKSELQPQR
jgi:hypothetical protein